MRGIPRPVMDEATRTGDAPLPGGKHGFGWVVHDIEDRHRRTYIVGHKATRREWHALMQRFAP